ERRRKQAGTDTMPPMAAPDPAEVPKVIDLASRKAARYLESIADRNVRDPRAEEVAASFRGDLPEDGVGAERALEELVAGIDGAGRAQVHRLARDGIGRLDVEALEAALAAQEGAPSLVIGSAGEVNAGDFDPIARMADLAERYGAWLHVDGAFGLFAALSERTRHLVEGIERADSVIADGHKWLNVPYDCGFAFVRDPSLQPSVFGEGAAYLPALDDPKPNWGYLGPEMSRRCRAFA